MNSLKNRTIAATAAMIATVATIGFAAPLRAEPISQTVVYSDLDLSTAAGQTVMTRRIRHAANAVCGSLEMSSRALVLDCRQRAIANAQARITALQVDQGAMRLASAR